MKLSLISFAVLGLASTSSAASIRSNKQSLRQEAPRITFETLADQYFAKALETYKTPAFVNLGISPEDMKNSIVQSILQVRNAPVTGADGGTPMEKFGVFNQANRESCSVTAMAAGMAMADPVRLAEAIASLYWTGTFPKAMSGMPNPCPYVLALNPSDDANGMQGAEFVWAVSVRDSRNQNIGGYNCDNVPSEYMITTHPTDGKTFLAVPDDEMWFCQHMYGKKCKQIQGSKACTSEKKCEDLLHDLVPAELAALKEWAVSGSNAAILFLGQQGTVTPYTGPYPGVKKVSETADLAQMLAQYYTPLSASDIKKQCKKGAMIALSQNVMQKGYCGDGTFGCQPPNAEPLDAMCATPGNGVCMSSHWVLLRDCDEKNGIANVWSWGAIFKTTFQNLAGMTTSIVAIP